MSVSNWISLEYRNALDVVCVWCLRDLHVKIICDQPALIGEINQRLTISSTPPWSSGLWVEPQSAYWLATLGEFSQQLIPGGRLAVISSLPPARRLPERRGWSGSSLGEQPGGHTRLLRALVDQGFAINSVHGLHTGQAVLLNAVAQCARKVGRLALADRLEFSARQHYIKPLSIAWPATCALILATRNDRASPHR
jgi:hypothetical protein